MADQIAELQRQLEEQKQETLRVSESLVSVRSEISLTSSSAQEETKKPIPAPPKAQIRGPPRPPAGRGPAPAPKLPKPPSES